MQVRLKHEVVTLRRKLKGWSMAKLAVVTGLSPQTICDLEAHSGRQARPETVKRIADALGVSIDDLYELVPEDQPEEQAVGA